MIDNNPIYTPSYQVYPDEKFDPSQIRRLALRYLRYWPLFIISIILLLAGTYFYNRYTTPRYSSQMTLMVKAEKKGTLEEVAEGLKGSSAASGSQSLENEIEILQSRSMAEATLRRLDFGVSYFSVGKFGSREMYLDRPFTVVIDSLHPQLLNATFKVKVLSSNHFHIESDVQHAYSFDPLKQESLANPVGFKAGNYQFGQYIEGPSYKFKLAPIFPAAGAEYTFYFNSLLDLAGHYAGSVWISPTNRSTTILRLSMEGTVPTKIVAYLNKLAETYIDKGLQEKSQMAAKAFTFIDEQLKITRDSLEQVESQLQQFRSKHRVMESTSEGQSALSRMQVLEKDKVGVDMKLQYFAYLQKYLQENPNPQELIVPTAMGVEAPELQTLIANLITLYTEQQELRLSTREENPYFRSLLQNIKSTKLAIEENIRNNVNLLKLQQQNLAGQISKADKQIVQLPGVERDLVNIRRKFTINETIYNYLLEKRAESGITKASKTPDQMILDRAISAYPVYPNTRRNYMFALLMGIGLPLGLLVIRDYFNDKITDVKDLQRGTQLPVLGIIPHNKYGKGLVAVEHPRSVVAESFRTLRSSLQYIASQKNHKRIMVTSGVSGEGKSFTAANLAASLATGGKKTCLLGLDLRRPRVQEEFSNVTLPGGQGLSTYLAGMSAEMDLVISSGIPNLDLIFSGPIPPNPSELLLGQNMIQLINRLEQYYDYVVMDTAPLGLVSDSLDLIHLSDVVIYMVRQGYSPRQTLDDLHAIKAQRNIKNLFLVLNDVALTGYNYGYGNKYGRGYYEEDSEKPARRKKNS
jgi:capsular exopolysaccharide synthesis family protein